MPERKVAPRQLYISIDNKDLLERIDEAIEAEYGPNSRKFSEWMLDAARAKLVLQGESPTVVAVRQAIQEETAVLREEIQALRKQLAQGTVAPLPPDDPDEPDNAAAGMAFGNVSFTG